MGVGQPFHRRDFTRCSLAIGARSIHLKSDREVFGENLVSFLESSVACSLQKLPALDATNRTRRVKKIGIR